MSGLAGEGRAVKDMRVRRAHISGGGRESPQQAFIYAVEALVGRGLRLGTWRVWSLWREMILMGSTLKEVGLVGAHRGYIEGGKGVRRT